MIYSFQRVLIVLMKEILKNLLIQIKILVYFSGFSFLNLLRQILDIRIFIYFSERYNVLKES